MYDRSHRLLQELNTHNIYSDFQMPNADEQAKERAEAAKKAEAERQERPRRRRGESDRYGC